MNMCWFCLDLAKSLIITLKFSLDPRLKFYSGQQTTHEHGLWAGWVLRGSWHLGLLRGLLGKGRGSGQEKEGSVNLKQLGCQVFHQQNGFIRD